MKLKMIAFMPQKIMPVALLGFSNEPEPPPKGWGKHANKKGDVLREIFSRENHAPE